MENEMSSRTAGLIGNEAVSFLHSANILVAGIGGVGGFAAECLVRCGVGRITFCDGDKVELSNCNRQLVALASTVGEFKADVMCRRAAEIFPSGDFHAVNEFITPESAADLVQGFDLVVDCIDDIPAKTALAAACISAGIPIVSSMGAAGRLDPTAVRCADIADTTNCPLAKALRRALKEKNITSGILAVYSIEKNQPRPEKGRGVLASISPVVGAFGCAVAGAAVKTLLRIFTSGR